MADEQQTIPPQEQQQQAPEKSERWQRRQERLARVKTSFPRVRVMPRDDIIRRDVKHPNGGLRFPAEGSVEWPFDSFTKRRISDGDVTIEEAPAETGQPEQGAAPATTQPQQAPAP